MPSGRMVAVFGRGLRDERSYSRCDFEGLLMILEVLVSSVVFVTGAELSVSVGRPVSFALP
jgi:hypothetical protein